MKPQQFIGIAKRLSRTLTPYFQSGRRPVKKSIPTIYLDFQDHSVFCRYHVSLAVAFSLLPANVVWRFRPRYFVRNRDFLDPYWWGQRFFRFSFSSSLPVSTGQMPLLAVVTDSPVQYQLVTRSRVISVVAGEKDTLLRSGDHEWPFLGFPTFLLRQLDLQNLSTAGTAVENRNRRVCFVGNCDPLHYSDTSHGLLSRAAAKRTIQEAFHAESLLVETWDDKRHLQNLPALPIVICNSFKAGLEFDEYQRLLRDSHFFLAFPGISSPYTHSLYECLSCGCVPILPESNLTKAGWVHLENCVVYKDRTSLIDAVHFALNAKATVLESLRASAEYQFRQQYSVASAAARLLSSDCRRLVLRSV